jgi:hypothetical protein
MEPILVNAHPQRSSRRWPRYQVNLPVRILGFNGVLTTPVTGRGTDISRAGMALTANVPLNPGDYMLLQFPTAEPSRVNAVVRYRSGSRFGLEFLSQLPPDDETKLNLKALPSPAASIAPAAPEALTIPCTPKMLAASLRRKQEEMCQLQKEIEVLSVAILLLADDEKEICQLPMPRREELGPKPWPLPS